MTLTLVTDLFIHHWYLILLFFAIAVIYSSVGFGGGSSYLAVLALTGMVYSQIRATSLLCNILVVSGNVFLYMKHHKYNWKKVIPLVVFSIPLAFIGGYLRIKETSFFILLGITLLFAAIVMWKSQKIVSSEIKKEMNISKNAFYGGTIGFISGIVGIGGGIFLAPFLHLINWDTPRKIAATASFFILVNSISGLVGQFSNPDFQIEWFLTSILLVTVFLGGILGNRLSNKLLSPIKLKKATAILIAFVSLRILWKSFL
ncbi:sulfite exporter TauE/SafE family protein [Tenacibaculum xiamenense]|uniref:sulfite exporter TauE/SafE family protein n=1 Tax=Tenacibaculum xiamenense TaxID=1261553 RepID=UPI0038944023